MASVYYNQSTSDPVSIQVIQGGTCVSKCISGEQWICSNGVLVDSGKKCSSGLNLSNPLVLGGLLVGGRLLAMVLPDAFEPLVASFTWQRAAVGGLLVRAGRRN